MNKVTISGIVRNNPVFSHMSGDMEMYKFEIEVLRTSGTIDLLPCVCTKTIEESIVVGEVNTFDGFIYSRNTTVNNKKTCETFFFANTKIETLENGENSVNLRGFLCKKPIYRTTPLGREITDFLIAVNRKNSKADYIHCIAWGVTASQLLEFNVGDEIVLKGRFQSRPYTKNIDGKTVTKLAYEVSASWVDLGV